MKSLVLGIGLVLLAWSGCLFSIGPRLVHAQVTIPFSDQITSTGWTALDCDPTQNIFVAQFFNGIVGVGVNAPSTDFSFSANCQGGSLTADPTSILAPPLATPIVNFLGVQGDNDNNQFSLVGQTCVFYLNARIIDPITEIVSFVQVDQVTKPCGPQGQSCDCNFFNVFCYIDCGPVGSAFFWLCIYVITVLVGLFFIWLPIEHQKLKNRMKTLQQYNAKKSVLDGERQNATHKNISDLTGKLQRGEVSPEDLMNEWRQHQELLEKPEVSALLRDRQLELAQQARTKAYLDNRPSGFWDTIKDKMGRRGGGEYSHVDEYLDPGPAVEMKMMMPEGPIFPSSHKSKAQFPNEPWSPAGPSSSSVSGGAFRRPRKTHEASDF